VGTILRAGRFRVMIYTNEGPEPAHVHVWLGHQGVVKVWLYPPRLAGAKNLAPYDQQAALHVVFDNLEQIKRAWHDFHPNN
jgi:hypothetical protein